MPLLRHGDVADALVVGVGAEVGAVRDVVEVPDAVPRAHLPAPPPPPGPFCSPDAPRAQN